MDSLDLNAATEAAELGASQAAAHADRVRPSWSATALNYLREYAAARPTSAFMAEDVRVAASLAGFPPPPDARAWGRVVQIARDMGLIAFAGYARQKSLNCHSSPKAMWRWAA